MKEKPILFSAPMVRAILDDKKVQTRRIIKCSTEHRAPYNRDYLLAHSKNPGWAKICPYGKIGDQLWVRETWQSIVEYDRLSPSQIPEESDVQYPATYGFWVSRRRPSIHMPRWASRIDLKITNIRVQQLNEITEEDALREGCYYSEEQLATAADKYADLWDEINGKGAWDENPCVWVIDFERIRP